jgi:hypothetical protein
MSHIVVVIFNILINLIILTLGTKFSTNVSRYMYVLVRPYCNVYTHLALGTAVCIRTYT